jgi:hypothetical protein
MAIRFSVVTFALALVAAGSSQAVSAQVRSLGNAIGGAFAKEAQILRQAQDQPAQPTTSEPGKTAEPAPAAAATKPPEPSGRVVQMRLNKGDALANGVATTCHQANGTTIRVSGGYRPAASNSGECR